MISNVTFRGAAAPVQNAEEPEKKVSAASIQESADEFSRSVEAGAEGVKKVTESATGAIATITGSLGMISAAVGNAFNKIIPDCVKEYFAPAERIINDAGEEIFKTIKNPDGTEKLIRHLNKGRATAWAAGATGATILAIGISHLAKSIKAKNAESAIKSNNAEAANVEPANTEVQENKTTAEEV